MTPRTRYVLLGVGGLALAVAVGLLVAFVLRSLPVARPAATAPAASSPSAPAADPAAPPPASEPEPRPEAGKNECVDALGDAAFDIDSVQLESHDGDLVVQFRFAAVPEGETGFGLSLERRGNQAYLLGVGMQDGEVDRVFVQDFGRSDTDDLDSDAVTVDGSTFTVVFERDAIKRIGNDWRWSAFATAAGFDPDLCPDSEHLEFER